MFFFIASAFNNFQTKPTNQIHLWIHKNNSIYIHIPTHISCKKLWFDSYFPFFFLVCATKYKKIKTKSIYRGRVVENSGFHGMTDTHLILEYYILLQKRNKYTQKNCCNLFLKHKYIYTVRVSLAVFTLL